MAQLKEGSIIRKSTGDEIIATLNDIDVGVNNLMPKSGGVLENYYEKTHTLMGTGNVAIDLSIANNFIHILPASQTTINYTISNFSSGDNKAQSFTLLLRQSVTPSTITFPASIKWSGGGIPNMSKNSGIYILTFINLEGTNWLGMFGGEF